MSNRLGTWQAGQLYENFKSRLKEYTEDTITPESFLDILNMNVDEYVSLAGLLDSDEYSDSLDLNPSTMNKGGMWLTGEDVVYTDATKNLYIPNATFGAGNWSASIAHFNSVGFNFLGAKVLFRQAAGNVDVFETYIAAIVDNNNVTLAKAFGSNLGENDFAAGFISIPGDSETINIGALTIYKQIDRIKMINSSLYGECIKKDLPAFKNIIDPTKYPAFSSYRNKIIYARDGEYLYFKKGNLATFGTRTLHFVRTPYHCTALTDLVDLRDGNVNIVQDNNLLDGLQTLKVPMPNELANAQSRRQEMRAAKNEEIVKNFERKE